MHLNVPTGYFLDGHLCWGDPGAGGVLSRIYAVDFPDTSGFDDQAFAEFENDFRLLLSGVKRDERMQLMFYTGNDFSAPLDRYAERDCNVEDSDLFDGTRRVGHPVPPANGLRRVDPGQCAAVSFNADAEVTEGEWKKNSWLSGCVQGSETLVRPEGTVI